MSDLSFFCSSFDDLSNTDLYAAMKLRADVFVVEQDCVFPDMDNCDQQAFHVLGKLDGEVVCYARLLAAGVKYPGPSIGRVVTASKVRRFGYGKLLMEESIQACSTLWPGQPIIISAQQYLEKFYQGFGFETRSEPYLEDGILHLEMHRA